MTSQTRPTWPFVFILALAIGGCEADVAPVPGPSAGPPPPAGPTNGVTSDEGGTGAGDRSVVPFREVAAIRGLTFRHDNGARGERILPETMGGGGGFLDVDGDGDLDIVLIDGGALGDVERPPNRLFRNDGRGHFEDVSTAAGIGDDTHGMGLAIGDVDNDGDPDLYVTNFGPNVLYLNQGDGSFQEKTPDAARLPTWSTSATFFDHDSDGMLDLYVVSYLDVTLETHHPCKMRGIDIYCVPKDYPGQIDHLLEGDGHAAFRDISAAAGIRTPGLPGRGLGVVASDFDDDGDTDLYVANDMDLNFLLRNTHGEGKGGPAFREEAIFLGGSASEEGRPEAGMGVDTGDLDGDGDFDLVVTNFEDQTNAVYRNESGLALIESSYSLGLGAVTLPMLAFGVRLFDFDLDGDLDLYVANGHVNDNTAELRQGSLHAQPDQLFENRDGHYVEILAPAFASGAITPRVGRAVASGDIDDDGDLDLLVVNNGGEVQLLENNITPERTRVGLRFEGTPPSNRDAYGAKVTVTAGGKNQVFEVRAGSSYLASHDPRIVAATLGDATATVTVRWPSGRTETWDDVPAGSYHTIVEGAGIRASKEFRAP